MDPAAVGYIEQGLPGGFDVGGVAHEAGVFDEGGWDQWTDYMEQLLVNNLDEKGFAFGRTRGVRWKGNAQSGARQPIFLPWALRMRQPELL